MRRAALLLLVAACHGEPRLLGEDEPIRVLGGTFREGELPGTPPVEGQDPDGSHVTLVESVNNVLRPGQVGKGLGGRATGDASAVGVRLGTLGSGYWIVPLGSPDPAVPGELTWALSLDVGTGVAPGLLELRFAAVDAAGAAGSQLWIPACVRGPIPDNLHVCDPSRPPPEAVLALAWDANVDLDLQVLTPAGKVVEPKHPGTAGPDEEAADGDGNIDRDGLAGCAAGARQENLVFQGKPLPGLYQVFVNLFDACDRPAVRFALSLHLAEGGELVEVRRVEGELVADQQNGGAALGLFVTELAIH